MKVLIKSVILFLVILSKNAHAQIDKRNWLIGGNGNFTYSQTKFQNGAKSNNNNVKISTNLGYFIADRLAFGVRPGFYLYKDDDSQVNIRYFDLGVFSRYYFLKSNPYYNIILQPEYSRSFGKGGGGTKNTYSILTGPVIYFNEHIALEFNVGYTIETLKYNPAKFYTLQSGIGLQIHLTK